MKNVKAFFSFKIGPFTSCIHLNEWVSHKLTGCGIVAGAFPHVRGAHFCHRSVCRLWNIGNTIVCKHSGLIGSPAADILTATISWVCWIWGEPICAEIMCLPRAIFVHCGKWWAQVHSITNLNCHAILVRGPPPKEAVVHEAHSIWHLILRKGACPHCAAIADK